MHEVKEECLLYSDVINRPFPAHHELLELPNATVQVRKLEDNQKSRPKYEDLKLGPS